MKSHKAEETLPKLMSGGDLMTECHGGATGGGWRESD